MHLNSHVKTLYDEIRSRALVQYFSPFVTVDLNRMAAAFNSPVGQLESELAALIMGGKISARIDSHNKVRARTRSRDATVSFADSSAD